jgi:hypothetical protein
MDTFYVLVKLQLPTKSGDILGAKGNSGDMVIKIEDTDNPHPSFL